MDSTQGDGVPDWYHITKDSIDACVDTPDLGPRGRYFRGGNHGRRLMRALEPLNEVSVSEPAAPSAHTRKSLREQLKVLRLWRKGRERDIERAKRFMSEYMMAKDWKNSGLNPNEVPELADGGYYYWSGNGDRGAKIMRALERSKE